jgi:hypothetical protein
MIGMETWPTTMTRKLMWLRPNFQFVRSIAKTEPPGGFGI